MRGDRLPVEDPAARELAALWAEFGLTGIAGALFGPGGRFPQWIATAVELDQLTAATKSYLVQ